MRRILIYGDVNLNYRDGSAVWLASLAQCLSYTESEVFVLLKADLQEGQQSEIFDSHVRVLTPYDGQISSLAGMRPKQAFKRITDVDNIYHFDVIISRGFAVASILASSGQFAGRFWPYLTEGPAFQLARSEVEQQQLSRIGEAARRVFVQTEEARSIVEAHWPEVIGKTLIMNPIVPDEALALGSQRVENDALSMVYAGKFAKYWNTLEMPNLPNELADIGIDAHLHMIGDKFQLTNNDEEWLTAMKEVSRTDTPQVTWHGGKSRADTLRIVSNADIGLSWRHPHLDSSPEVSTKMLEYAALGVAPVLNRSAMHERLLGRDYPLFVDTQDVLVPLRRAAKEKQTLHHARNTARRMAEQFSMSSSTVRFENYFVRSEDHHGKSLSSAPFYDAKRVFVVGQDLSACSALIEILRQRSDIDLVVQSVLDINPDALRSMKVALDAAEIVVSEGVGSIAKALSRSLRPDQKLLIKVRECEYIDSSEQLDIENVSGLIFDSDFHRHKVLHLLGWPEHKTTVMHDMLDEVDLLRPKLPNTEFQLGMVGYTPAEAGLDRALSLLKRLIQEDDRYILRLRGEGPWNNAEVWDDSVQQETYRQLFAALATEPELKQHIVFEPPGLDIGSWFRKVGWVLGPSNTSAFEMAPFQGMMTGAIPVIWNRPGVNEIYSEEFVHQGTDEAASYILDNSSVNNYKKASNQSVELASKYELMKTRDEWFALIARPIGEFLDHNGISILRDVDVPRDRAEATAMFYEIAAARGVEDAYLSIKNVVGLLDPQLRTRIHNWLEVISWTRDPSRILPPADLSPLFHTSEERALHVGGPISEFHNYGTILANKIVDTGNLFVDVHVAADAIVRQARRERPSLIVASGTLSLCFGALVASRRLGISFQNGGAFFSEVPVFLRSMYEELLALYNRQTEEQNSSSRRSAPGASGDTIPLSDLTIGLIADEFTFETISAEVTTIALDRYGWEKQIDQLDAIIVESAWAGPGGQWFHGVAYHGEEEAKNLWELIEACKSQGIPTIFWNKEDPVHFESFVRAAGRSDHIFSTDADTIPSYLLSTYSRTRTVASLSFFAQPKIHTAIKRDNQWTHTAAFSGTYYGKRYPKRSSELRSILDIASVEGLTIYDRQHENPESPYQFPAELQDFSVGALTYHDMLEAYKSHPVHINVNSVSSSPSMFSRRVVEIAASGSLVLSGIGQGVSEVLGEAFPVLENSAEWQNKIHEALTDEDARIKGVLEQFRTIMRSHRADQAIALMLRIAGLPVEPSSMLRVGWLAKKKEVVYWAARQTVPPTILTASSKIRGLAEGLGLAVVPPEKAEDAGMNFIGRPTRRPARTLCEDLMLIAYQNDADVVSITTKGKPSDSLIQSGLGDKKFSLVRVSPNAPTSPKLTYKLRVPKDYNVVGA